MKRTILFALLLLATPALLTAQSGIPSALPDTAPNPYGVVPGADVTEPPGIVSSPRRLSTPPRGVRGRVVLEFVVDSTGLIDTTSIRIISAADPALEALARTDVAKIRFTPARIGRRPVRLMVRQAIRY